MQRQCTLSPSPGQPTQRAAAGSSSLSRSAATPPDTSPQPFGRVTECCRGRRASACTNCYSNSFVSIRGNDPRHQSHFDPTAQQMGISLLSSSLVHCINHSVRMATPYIPCRAVMQMPLKHPPMSTLGGFWPDSDSKRIWASNWPGSHVNPIKRCLVYCSSNTPGKLVVQSQT